MNDEDVSSMDARQLIIEHVGASLAEDH